MASASTKPWAVVVLNMGGPDSMEAVEPFLRNLLSDPELVRLPFPMSLFQKTFARLIAKRRLAHASHGYEHMGGSSPLLHHTTELDSTRARGFGHRGASVRRHALLEPAFDRSRDRDT
jgi:ferrochelatase